MGCHCNSKVLILSSVDATPNREGTLTERIQYRKQSWWCICYNRCHQALSDSDFESNNLGHVFASDVFNAVTGMDRFKHTIKKHSRINKDRCIYNVGHYPKINSTHWREDKDFSSYFADTRYYVWMNWNQWRSLWVQVWVQKETKYPG